MPIAPPHSARDGWPPRDAMRDVDAREGHAVQPEVVRETSTLESLATTLKAWAPFDTSAAPLSPGSVASHASSPRMDRGAVLHSEEEGEEEEGDAFIGSPQRERERKSGAKREEFLDDAGERVSWARWDELEVAGGERPRRILILGYKNGGVAIWDCSSLDTWVELLNLPTLDAAFDSKLRRKFPRGAGTTSSAAVLPSPVASSAATDAFAADRPLVAFSASPVSSSGSPSLTVFLYSLRNHRIIDSLSLPGIAHRILSNRRHLVVSTTSPSALHILRAHDLAPAPFSPLTDVARSPFDGTPVFDLGAGGRLLVCATDRPLLSSRLDRAPARPGAGILAHRGLFDSDPAEGGSGGASSSSAFAAEAAHAGGEVARRVGEGVMSGVKAIGEAGMSYWMSRAASGRTNSSDGHDSPSYARGAGEDGGRTFSRSAPQPSLAGFGRRTSISGLTKLAGGGDGAAGFSASSASSASSSTAGTVLVVDLLSPTPVPSTKSSRARTVSSTPSGPAAPSPVKVVAHFRPYAQPLALVSLSPSSTQVLTAPAAGHAFDVFELKPAVRVGVSATSSASGSESSSTSSGSGKVWHRYRLSRGYTSARASAASWSPDARFVAVSTSNARKPGGGTAHVYALNATGGAPSLEGHFAAKVGNARELSPLSVGMGAVARVRAPTGGGKREDESAGVGSPPLSRRPSEAGGAGVAIGASFPSVVFLPKGDSIRSAFRPTAPPPPSASATTSPRQAFSPPLPPTSTSSSASRAPTTFQDLTTFHPSLGSATLHRLSLAEASPPPLATLATAAEDTIAAASRGDVRGVLSTTGTAAVSGLSQLMRRNGNGGAAPAPSTSHGGAREGGKDLKREWTVRAGTLAGWRLGREKGWGEVRERLFDEDEEGDEEEEDERARREVMGLKKEEKKRGVRYSAFAEIETFSRSPLVLPRSIYQSQQFDFYALPPTHAASTKKGNFSLLPLRRLEVRPEVRIRQGNDALTSDHPSPSLSGRHASPRLAASYASSTSFEPASFDQPIKTAMQTFLEAETLLAPGSPKLVAPAYPNGVPGKHGSWRDTMARHVAPAALEGIGKVRQGLGRVRIPSVAALPSGMIPLPLGRNKTAPSTVQTASGATGGVAYSSSLSFEDDDAVFAERNAFEEGGASVGTAFTSEDEAKGVAGGVGLGVEDDEDWGWDDRIGAGEDDERQRLPKPASSSSIATPSSGALETPFEEDFDDFELELPGQSPIAGTGTAVKPLTLDQPSPFALDPIDDHHLDGAKLAASSSAVIPVPVPSGLPKHLAPPVSLYPSPASSSSPTTIGTTVPTSLGSSPSSLSSITGSGFDSSSGSSGLHHPASLLDRPGSALSGIGILAPSPAGALGLAAPTNGPGGRSASPALSSSPSGGSSGSGKKKKRR
ncbi:hypothetical protein JCM6882_006750 [Rhodosporidiobolus microsporus]